MPLGATLVFKGMEQTMPFLHGSQGCSTYIRRYMISHFREPVDIASSNFTEESAVFGGGDNVKLGLKNIIEQYKPKAIGIATTCLSETMGDDIVGHLREFKRDMPVDGPHLIHVSTPSYAASHAEGFTAAVKAVVEQLVDSGISQFYGGRVNIFPNMISPADLRYVKEIADGFTLPAVILPDYSETLDGPSWGEYALIPPGGTPLEDIPWMGQACASISFGRITNSRPEYTAAYSLQQRCGVESIYLGMPVGLRETDRLYEALAALSGRTGSPEQLKDRGRLVDAFVDGHKYVSGKRALIYGEEDLVVALASLYSEAGLIPVVCASGGESGHLRAEIEKVLMRPQPDLVVAQGADFADIDEIADTARPDIIIGNSKGYKLARRLGKPLIRLGFPVHDRMGAQRIMHCGYRGALELYDRIVNALMDAKQENSDIGYSYL